MYTLGALTNDAYCTSMGDEMEPVEALVDSGASATAGGCEAVEALVAAVPQANDRLKIFVDATGRPWFRFGNGQRGQGLYRVDMQFQTLVMSVFALEARGAP
eukprot:12501929-Alexandrium_andersonii.AAC.1